MDVSNSYQLLSRRYYYEQWSKNPISELHDPSTFSPHTQRGYIAAVKGLADFYKKSPDLLTNDQMQDYFRYLI